MGGNERVKSRDAIVRDLVLANVDESYRLATRLLHDRVAAQDAVQEAALRAWASRTSLRDPAQGAAWLARIVVNVCRDGLRSKRRKPGVVSLDVVAGGPQIAGVANGGDIAHLIARLSADDQVLLGLRFGRDLPVEQIAAYLGLPEGTVKSRLHSAVTRLRAELSAERRERGVK